MSGSGKVLVVGATGSLGGAITRGLVGDGRDVRILVRPQSAYGELVELGCEPVLGDLKDMASLDVAVSGIETIVATAISIMRPPPDSIETVELGGYASLIGAAQEARVRQFVYTSALTADARSPIPFVAAKGVTEERLRASGLGWTILGAEAFMDVWLGMVVAGPAFEGREVVFVGTGDRVHSFVHSRDVAAVAVRVVGNPAAYERYIPVGGPAAISIREAIAIFEGVLGHPIASRSVAPGEPVPGLPPMIAGMLAMLDDADSRVDMTDLCAELGLELTSVVSWAQGMVRQPVA